MAPGGLEVSIPSWNAAGCSLPLNSEQFQLEAQGILYKLHYQAVFRTAYGLTRNYDLAEDVTQEVFIELFTAIKRYDPRRPFAPWLHGIAAHKSLDRIRNSPKWKVVLIADADNIPSLNPSPEDFVVRSELAEAIWAEVGTLRPKQQAVVVLYYYKSFSVAEISQALGCPRATVRVRLHYARARLGDALRHLQEPPEEPGLTDPIPKNSQAPISPGLAEAKLARIGGQADQMACSYIPAEVEVETW